MSNLHTIKFNGYEQVQLIKWKVKKGSALSDSTILFLYSEHGVEKRFKSENYGLIVNLLLNENEFISPGQEIIEYEKCAHPTVMKDLCAECGLDLRKTDNYDNNASVSMIHSVPELKVNVEQAQQLGKADEEKLLSSRKLVLLVDLDQTLIHTTNQPSEQVKNKNVISFRLYSAHSQLYYTKLRPFINKFLDTIAKYYELHICTFGARMYAHKIAELLDPEKKLFSHRILSRDECFDPQLKTGNLKALFPCGDSMVCIIDDREDVWNYQPNLITVKPYTYFRNTGDINSPNKQKDDLLAKAAKVMSNKDKVISTEEEAKQEEDEQKEQTANQSKVLNESNVKNELSNVKEEDKKDQQKIESTAKDDQSTSKDELINNPKDEKQEDEIKDDSDDYLLYLLEILKKIHRKFYMEYDEIIKYSAEGEHIKIPDLKNLVPSIRRDVLKGCNIVFTGLIPTKLELEQSKLWITAKQLGANVSKDIVKDGSPLEKTTHLIASNPNTQKVQEALKLKQIHVVNPIWLYICSERWERVDERLYPLNKTDDFRNPDKLKDRLSLSEQMFLNYDLVKLSSLAKQSTKSQSSSIMQSKRTDEQKSLRKQMNNIENPFPVYDPITGKLIRTNQTIVKQQQQHPSTSKEELQNEDSMDNEENLTPHCMLELEPLSVFSDNDLGLMNKEVDDACSEDEEESDESMQQGEIEEQYDEDDSDHQYEDYGDEPVFKKRKREIETLSSSSSSEDTNLSFEDSNSNLELGGQLEKDLGF